MKRILTSTAVALVIGTSAFAASHLDGISNSLSERGYEVNVAALTESQVNDLEALFADSSMSPALVTGRIETILDDGMGMMVMDSEKPGRVMVDVPMNSLRKQVGNRLSAWGMDRDVNELSRQEVSELFVLINSADDDTEAQNNVKAFFDAS